MSTEEAHEYAWCWAETPLNNDRKGWIINPRNAWRYARNEVERHELRQLAEKYDESNYEQELDLEKDVDAEVVE